MTARRPRTVERRVQMVAIAYQAEELNAAGERVEVHRTAMRGDLVTVGLVEAARLDAHGALAPPGTSLEAMDQNAEAVRAQYLQARQSVGGAAGGESL